MELTVYEKPTCTTCRHLGLLLENKGIEYARVDCVSDPLSEVQLRALLSKAKLRPKDVLRMRVAGAEDLPLEDDAAIFRAIAENPELLQRPIVERGDRAVLARPLENVLPLLD